MSFTDDINYLEQLSNNVLVRTGNKVFHQVKILTPDGQVKEIITSEMLAKRHWKRFNSGTYFKNQIKGEARKNVSPGGIQEPPADK